MNEFRKMNNFSEVLFEEIPKILPDKFRMKNFTDIFLRNLKTKWRISFHRKNLFKFRELPQYVIKKFEKYIFKWIFAAFRWGEFPKKMTKDVKKCQMNCLINSQRNGLKKSCGRTFWRSYQRGSQDIAERIARGTAAEVPKEFQMDFPQNNFWENIIWFFF